MLLAEPRAAGRVSGQATVNSLSDELLGKIFATDLLKKQLFRLPLVCKRWSQVIGCDDKLWGSTRFCPEKDGDLRSFLLWARCKREKIWGLYSCTRRRASLAALAQLTALQSLTLDVSGAAASTTQVHMDLLVGLTKLQQLELVRTSASTQAPFVAVAVDISSLRHLPGLTHLKIGRGITVEGGASAVASSAPSLSLLRASVVGWTALMPVSGLSMLRSLEVDARPESSLGSDLSELLPKLCGLTFLSLGYLTGSRDLSVSGTTHTCLIHLCLRGMIGLQQMPLAMLGLSSLKVLDIQHMPIDLDMSAFLGPISHSNYLPGMRRLILGQVYMPTFPDAVTNLQGLTCLVCLPFKEQGDAQFTSLPEKLTALRHLRDLRLLGMKVLSLDVSILLAMPSLATLHIPECKHLQLKDAQDNAILKVMHALQGHPSLTDVNLAGTILMC